MDKVESVRLACSGAEEENDHLRRKFSSGEIAREIY